MSKQKTTLAIGLMSGTSADGIDAALVRIDGSPVSPRVELLAFNTYAFPKGFREMLLRNSNADTARLDEITRLNTIVAKLFAGAARKIAKRGVVSLERVNFIGSHGQTIQHRPEFKRQFGVSARGTMQIGDPSIIAQETGVVTVGDFRQADIGAGGSGAPLVPYVDFLTFRSLEKNRAVLNIGGIANITLLPAGATAADVLAFDTGPGNMLIDTAMRLLFSKPYDKGGKIAAQGRIIPEIIAELMKDRYYRQRPPKSTGRELFNEPLVKRLIASSKKIARPEDVISTLTEFTALSIQQSVARFGGRCLPLHELYVGGGGANNPVLMDSLAAYFGKTKILPTGDQGFPADAKEAMCFAMLAHATINGVPSNLPGATGAKRRVVLGKICLG